MSSRQALTQLQACKLHFNHKTPVLHPITTDLNDFNSIGNYLLTAKQRLQTNSTQQDWLVVAWVLGRGENDLIANFDFMQQLALQLQQHPQANLILKRLIYSYFCQFQPTNQYQNLLGALIIKALATKQPDEWLKNWKQQQRKYHIFAPQIGIDILAQHCVRRGELEFLPALGFKGQLLRSAYICTLYVQILNKLKDSKKDPSNKLKSALQEFAGQNYGDPRYQVWPGLLDTISNLICKWLIADTIMAFMQILTDLDQCWQYRQEFWWEYYQQGHIEQAWLILANGVKAQISETYPHLQYANLTGSGIRSQHCVLLLKIKNLIIADWSHQGRCHIWLSPEAPKFYAPEYTRQQLTQGSAKIKPEYSYNGINHHNSESGGWQTDVANFIAQHC